MLAICGINPKNALAENKPSSPNAFQRILSKLKTQSNKDEGGVSIDTPPSRNPFIPSTPKKKEKPKPEPKPVKKPPERRTPQLWKPRPTKPAPRAITKAPSLKITGIVWNSDRPQAIINDQVIDIGDKVQNATIKEITKTEIKVEYGGKEFSILYGRQQK